MGHLADVTLARTGRGAGTLTLIVGAYAVLALAAGGRAGAQLISEPAEAPFPYGLTAVAAAVYLGGALLLRRTSARARGAARLICGVELIGVLCVGTSSVLRPEWLGASTVWSYYGLGYACVPLVLPIAALWWLAGEGSQPARHRPTTAS